MKKSQNAQAKNIEYGKALLSNRGGWTLKEMLGSNSGRFTNPSGKQFTDRDYQKSAEEVAKPIPPQRVKR